jgi:membrane-associated phospholipid phosphatase
LSFINDIMRRFILIMLAISSWYLIGAQNTDTSKIVMDGIIPKQEKVWIVKAFLQDEAKLWTSLAKCPDKSKLYWVPVLGATIYSIYRDEVIYAGIKTYQSKHKWVSGISPVITYGGDNLTLISTCALFYFGGLAFKNDKAMQTGLISAEALVVVGIISRLGKIASGRQRPSYARGEDHWNWFPASLNGYKKGYLQSAYDAFPSGHTIAAWSVATVIAKRYKDNEIVPVLCYTLATGVGLSRITEDTHWLSDVIIGGALGYCVGNFVSHQRANNSLTIFPVLNKKSVSISLSMNF